METSCSLSLMSNERKIKKIIIGYMYMCNVYMYICIHTFQLGSIFYNYYKIEKDSEELIDEYVMSSSDADKNAKEEDPLKRVVDFKKLKERNSDVIGWLYIPDTTIDEPILKGKTNDTYLYSEIKRAKQLDKSLLMRLIQKILKMIILLFMDII